MMLSALVSVLLAVTAGWENAAPERKDAEVESAKLLWSADRRSPDDFRLIKRNGAEGEMTVKVSSREAGSGIEIMIRKTNALGELIVEAPRFVLSSNVTAQVSAEVTVSSATPGRSHGCVMTVADSGMFGVQPAAQVLGPGNGRNIMFGLNEQPADTYYRKYCYYIGDGAEALPVIIISGDPSESSWRNWRAEDYSDSKLVYQELRKDTERRRQAAGFPIASSDAVARQCAESIDHTARLVTENGVPYLLLDGKRTAPVAYHSLFHMSDFSEITAAQPITSRGVPFVVAWVNGSNARQMEYTSWLSGRDYDARKAADIFREMMRGDTNALYLVAFDCNAPRDFVEKCCPDEVWTDEHGDPVIGNNAIVLWNRGADYDPASYWPWPSMASPTWRETIKAFIRDFVAELKRTGHSRRVVGVHFQGYYDGQFSMRKPDYSPCAKREYERYVKANPQVSTNYWQFCRQLGVLAQADFAKTFKAAMGKDVVAIRWDDAPFVAEYSQGTVDRDPDGIDITVSQPSYSDRYPAVASVPYVPWSSLALHNKMHWYELDLRTWWSIVGSSASGDVGSGNSPDLQHWGAVYHKLAGQMLAGRSGFWFYDMGRGWFAGPEIADDIGESLKVMQRLNEKTPSSWTSDVAVVVDEEGQFGVEGGPKFQWEGTLYNLCERQLDYMSAAGIPYDHYLAEDVIANPAILKDKKVVVFIFWRQFDAKRIAAIKALAGRGQTHVFLCESGCLGGAREATGFEIEYFNRDVRPHALVAEPHFRESVISSFESEMHRGWLPTLSSNATFKTAAGRQVWIKEGPGVIVHARYRWDASKVAIAQRRDPEANRWYLAAPGGLTPEIFQRIVRESGAYMPLDRPGLMVSMNGDFISVHALKGGEYDFRLPFACRVVNGRSGLEEPSDDGHLHLKLTPGETCWFLLESRELNFRGRNFRDAIDGLTTVRRELMALRGKDSTAKIALGASGNPVLDRELVKYAKACSNVVAKGVSEAATRPGSLRNACTPKTRVMEYHNARGTDWWTDRLQIKRDQILRQPDHEFDVVMLGDSITHFFEWPYFDKSYDRFIWKYRTLNLGYGGDRTENVIWRCENGELDGYRTKCVTLMIGTNNPDPAQDVAAGIKRILEIIAEKQPQATVVLMPIFPRGKGPDDPPRVKNDEVNRIIRGFADGKKVVWLDFNCKLMNEQGDVKDFFEGDRLHPNARGYKVWLEALDPVLERIVRPKQEHKHD